MKRLLLVALILLLTGTVSWGSQAHAASTTTVYKGGGWTLTMTSTQMSYGTAFSGSFKSASRTFPMHGDWIPAGDAGGDLLRFYGHPFGSRSGMGLVGLATYYSTCQPNCAAAKTFSLHAIAPFPKLPGVNRPTITLKFQK